MKKLLLIFHTVKFLKWSQIYYRLYRKLVKPKPTEVFSGQLPVASPGWVDVFLYEERITEQWQATFLNHTKKLDFPADWNDESHSKLWTYNLHYFEDLISFNAKNKQQFNLQLLDLWIAQNPWGIGNGWESYPMSLRICNILKAWHAGLPLTQAHFISIYAQVSYLSNNLEKHLLGNHYFVNLKSLLFAGVIFSHQRWLNIAKAGLLEEIPEQILADGANFELSPMYHCLILVDMLDMLNLYNAYSNKFPSQLVLLIRNNIPKMLRFMELMSHPDGGVAFFNDSVDGIAPKKEIIRKYAELLGFPTATFDQAKTQLINLEDSGYLVAAHNGNKLIFDAANIGPTYIPGHAHADTLSFELSISKERVFVNSGVSQYGTEDKRLLERKTSSHNTVEVNNTDSSQVWSAFRVAERAEVIKRYAQADSDNLFLYGCHNGFKKIINGPLHARKIILGSNSLIVRDELIGNFKHATAYFYFHPNLNVYLNNDKLTVIGKMFILQAELKTTIAHLCDSIWHPSFGINQPNKCLTLTFTDSESDIKFTWALK